MDCRSSPELEPAPVQRGHAGRVSLWNRAVADRPNESPFIRCGSATGASVPDIDPTSSNAPSIITTKKILAFAFIYLCLLLFRVAVPRRRSHATHHQNGLMRSAVGSLWGDELVQMAPTFDPLREEEETITRKLADGAVAGMRFALVETGIAQLIFLVLFAYTIFLEGFTGLVVTGLSIATPFVVMQATGRVDWEQLLTKPDSLSPKCLASATPRKVGVEE